MTLHCRSKAMLTAAIALALWVQPASAAEPAKPWSTQTTAELIANAPADAWVDLPADQTLYLDFVPAPNAAPVRVVIALAPALAPRHVAAV